MIFASTSMSEIGRMLVREKGSLLFLCRGATTAVSIVAGTALCSIITFRNRIS